MESPLACQIIDDLILLIEQHQVRHKTGSGMHHTLSTMIATSGYKFGHIHMRREVIIAESALSFASVNLKPITAGHLLVMPKRVVPRVSGLDASELGDIWYLAQQMSIMIERKYDAKSITFAIQDGKYAGQTIDHVHIHVIPRHPKDYANNDDIYVDLERDAGTDVQPLGVEDDSKRKVQSMQEMIDEANSYKAILNLN